MGRDASWLATLPSACDAVFTVQFIRESDPKTLQNGETVLLIANLMADSESGSPDSYSSFPVTIRLCRLVSEIFACDRQIEGPMDVQHGPLL